MDAGTDASATQLFRSLSRYLIGIAFMLPMSSLTYHFGERRIVWNVQNTASRGLDGSQRGTGVTIDAITGEVLEEFGWSAIP